MARVLALDEDLAEARGAGPRPRPHPVRPCRRGGAGCGHGGLRRLRPQCPCAAAGDQAGASLCRFRRAEPDLGNAGGLVKHNGPLAGSVARARSRASMRAGRWIFRAGRGWRRRSPRWPTTSPMSTTTSTMGCARGCSRCDDLVEAPLAGPFVREVVAALRRAGTGRLIGEIVRRLMSALIGDLLEETRARLAHSPAASADAVRRGRAGRWRRYSEPMAGGTGGAQAIPLRTDVSPRPRDGRHGPGERGGGRAVRGLQREPALLPPDWAAGCGGARRRGHRLHRCAIISPA